MGKSYRPCVVAVFIDSDKRVLVGKRSDNGAWQFPQGGIEPYESAVKALYREMDEEIGCQDFEVLRIGDEQTNYDFPKSLNAPIAGRHCGQSLHWFLCRFKADHSFDLSRASSDEFTELSWTSPAAALSSVIGWKKAAYRRGLRMLGLRVGVDS